MDVSACQVSATVNDATDAGFASVAPGASPTMLTVSTFGTGGGANDRAFNLLVAC